MAGERYIPFYEFLSEIRAMWVHVVRLLQMLYIYMSINNMF